MGGCLSKFQKKRNISLAVVGLDGAGKTTIVHKLARQPTDQICPTVGLNTLTIRKGRYEIELFDLGGTKSFRALWPSYYPECHGLIYVYDASNIDTTTEAEIELRDIFYVVQDKPVLIYLTNRDRKESWSPAKIIEETQMEDFTKNMHVATTRRTLIKNCQLDKDFKLLLKEIGKDFDNIDARVQMHKSEQKEKIKREKEERITRVMKRKEEEKGSLNN